MSQDDDENDKDVEGDHCWQFRYNRSLSCFSHSVAQLTFSQDGKWLVAATTAGNVKIFDTGIWAEAAKLQGCLREEARVLAISPAQRWLVCMYPSAMHIFQCQPPWRLEARIPAPVDPMTKTTSEWCCVAFSPLSEVDDKNGKAGQDNHLAAFASKTLCVLDYSGGWGDVPKSTRSFLDGQRPTSLAYTSCGFWLVCGYESGQVQIWNHFSLTLDRTLFGHNGVVSCIASSPRCADYHSRFISCGLDPRAGCALRVWHSHGWVLEQVVPDMQADRNGIRSCEFSCSGDWVVSVAVEMCIWRVCISLKGKLELRLHQRLTAVGSSAGLCTAAYCCLHDAIAVGSRDGVLGVWTKFPGFPEEHGRGQAATGGNLMHKCHNVTPWMALEVTLPRPMRGVKPDPMSGLPCGVSTELDADDDMRRSLRNSEWFVRSDMRSLSGASPPRMPRATGRSHRASSEASANGTSSAYPSNAVTPKVQKVAAFGMQQDGALRKSSSEPPSRWKPAGCGFADALGAYSTGNPQPSGVENVTRSHSRSRRMLPIMCSVTQAGTVPLKHGNASGRSPGRSSLSELPPLVEDEKVAMRQALLHATKGLVQRISLDPKNIC